jgi:hypothetical protein
MVEIAVQKRSNAVDPPSAHEAPIAAVGLRTATRRNKMSTTGTNGRGVGLDMTVLLAPRET